MNVRREILRKFKPFKLSTPIHLDVVFPSSEYANLAAEMPRSRLADSRTISYAAEDYREAWSAYSTALSLALARRWHLLNERLKESEEAKRIMEEWYKELWRRWATEPPPFPPIK